MYKNQSSFFKLQIQVKIHTFWTLCQLKSSLNIHNLCARNNLSAYRMDVFILLLLDSHLVVSLWLVFCPSTVFFPLLPHLPPPSLRFHPFTSCNIPTTMRRKHFSSKSQPYFLGFLSASLTVSLLASSESGGRPEKFETHYSGYCLSGYFIKYME